MKVSIVTPWLNHSELCPVYERSVKGAQVIVVDNGSIESHKWAILAMVKHLGGVYIRNEENRLFAAANNQGLEQATGEIVLFMNNDVECRPGFLDKVAADVKPGGLYGPSLLAKHGLAYLEGWCIAAYREVWLSLKGWDAEYYSGLYWEDNDLCWRAAQMGYTLNEVAWPVYHYNNYTSGNMPGAMDKSAENEAKFLERVRAGEAA